MRRHLFDVPSLLEIGVLFQGCVAAPKISDICRCTLADQTTKGLAVACCRAKHPVEIMMREVTAAVQLQIY